MAKLTHAAIASLDGYVEDEEGKFNWAVPDEEGAELAGNAIGAGLVDERHLFLFPVVVGGGKRTRVNQC